MTEVAQPTLLQEVVELVQGGLAQPRVLWQFVVIAASVGIGWLLAQQVRRQIDQRAAGVAGYTVMRADLVRLSVDGLRRLAFPVTALLLLLAGGLLLRGFGLIQRPADAQLLRLALTLLTAMAGIRLGVYALRRALPTSTWLVSFERWIALLVWLGVALHLTGLLGDVIEALRAMRLPVGRAQLSALDLIEGAISIVVTVIGALWLAASIESRLERAQTLTPNSRVILTRLVKALLLLLAVLLALASAGIDLTVLSVFGGALGVGLALGLQRIASNYVSGFIILLDRSLALGDLITLDKFHGRVTKIETRYTVIRAPDGTETILPNEMLMSTPVINHSGSNREVRVTARVPVAAGADLARALAVLTEVAAADARVLRQPAPGAVVTDVRAESVELELAWSLGEGGELAAAVRSDILRAVLLRFASEGIGWPPAAGAGAGARAGRPPAA